MARRQQPAGGLVDPGGHRLAGPHALHQHDRHGQVERGHDVERLALRDRDHDRLDGLVEEPVDGAAQGVRAQVGQADLGHGVARVVGGLLHRAGDHARPVQPQVRPHQPDQPERLVTSARAALLRR